MSTTKKNGAKAPIATADSIFKSLGSVEFFSDYKLMFTCPSKHGLKLIVRKGTESFCVYCYPEVLEHSDCKNGDTISILAEQRDRDGATYWNVTGISKQ